MCLANLLEVVGVEGGWGQAPVNPGSRGSPSGGHLAPALCSAALCLSAFHSLSRVCRHAHRLLPRCGQGPASFSLSPVLFASPGGD